MKLIERARRIKSLERLKAEIDINLQNNYKSIAHEALARFTRAVEAEEQNGVMTPEQTAKYRVIATAYAEMMRDYRH